MGSSPFDSKYTIEYSNLEFLFGIVQQGSDYFLLNYLASKFNAIQDQQSRKLKIHDWIYSIKWLIDIYEFYSHTDFHYSFCKRMFHDELIDENFNNLYKTQHFLESIENRNNFEDLQFIGEKRFDNTSFHDLYIQGKPKADIDFFSCSVDEQSRIMDLYKTYLHYWNDSQFGDENESNVVADSIDTMLRKEIYRDLNTQENIELLREICHKFMTIKKNSPDQQISDNDIEDSIIERIRLDSNLNLIAYYLHYIIYSFGIIPDKKLESGVRVFAGKQVDLLQRLLCSISTHNWETADAKSNSYYKTVNGLFKFEKLSEKDNYERDKVIKHLTKVRKMLAKGGFDDAVKLLDTDVQTINGK